MSWIPASSSTARTPPPAMTPVPGEAGFRNTRPAPKMPVVWCVIVAPWRGTRKRFFFGALDALLDRERDLVGLAVARADDAVLVADDHERGEREAPAALDDLGDAVDLDDALLEVEAGAGRRNDRGQASQACGLEGQPALAGALGKGLHAAVVLVSAAVEDRGLDAGGLGALGEQLARPRACSMRGASAASASVQLTAASVRPATSSMSWAKTPRLERNTEIRGRSAVPRDLRADAAAALEALGGAGHDGHARFPTFRATYSPS